MGPITVVMGKQRRPWDGAVAEQRASMGPITVVMGKAILSVIPPPRH